MERTNEYFTTLHGCDSFSYHYLSTAERDEAEDYEKQLFTLEDKIFNLRKKNICRMYEINDVNPEEYLYSVRISGKQYYGKISVNIDKQSHCAYISFHYFRGLHPTTKKPVFSQTCKRISEETKDLVTDLKPIEYKDIPGKRILDRREIYKKR
jgi:hypothetical protein